MLWVVARRGRVVLPAATGGWGSPLGLCAACSMPMATVIPTAMILCTHVLCTQQMCEDPRQAVNT